MDEVTAMDRAARLAAGVLGRIGPNPRVGCVLLDSEGEIIAEGQHRGPGTAHAEAAALALAGPRAAGCTAVVTLEPCNHHGRTPPCASALIAAGVRRVVYAEPDPTRQAAGGAETLRDAGVQTAVLATQATARLNKPWLTAVTRGLPYVTYKVAATLDGYVAAADGTSQWITGAAARALGHELRATVDAIVVGTGTALADRPQLTVRLPGADLVDEPMRVVVGDRGGHEGLQHLPGHDVHAQLSRLYGQGVRHILLEGGPGVGGAWLRADVVDELLWCTAPILLGSGVRAIAELGIPTLADGLRWTQYDLMMAGPDTVHRLERLD